MPKKIYNNAEYRDEKRVVGFINKDLKKKLLAFKKSKKISISKALGIIVADYFSE